MPISHKHKIIFVHIPKTGGTSIERFFGMTNNENMYEMKNISIDDVSFSLQHLTPYYLKTWPGLAKYYDEYFKFVFVRNPYSRVVSEYFWRHRMKTDKINPVHFSKWLRSFYKELDMDHKLPQVDYIYLDGKIQVDFVGRVENMNDDFSKILKHIGMNESISLPKDNVTKKTIDKKLLLTKENKEFIYSIYKKDFEQFNYDA